MSKKQRGKLCHDFLCRLEEKDTFAAVRRMYPLGLSKLCESTVERT